MPNCSNCGIAGHNKSTCGKYNNTIFDLSNDILGIVEYYIPVMKEKLEFEKLCNTIKSLTLFTRTFTSEATNYGLIIIHSLSKGKATKLIGGFEKLKNYLELFIDAIRYTIIEEYWYVEENFGFYDD